MKIDPKKLKRQQLGVHKFINASDYGGTKCNVGTLNYCMGVGKTFTAIILMKHLFKTRQDNHFVILVPSESLKLQWEKELSIYLTKGNLTKIEVFTINKIVVNKMFIKTITLIADEIHEYMSPEYIKAINGTYIGKTEMLGLTGTATDSKDVMEVLSELCPVIDVIDEQEAIEEGYISNFVEYNISTTLTEEEQELYDRLSEIITKNMAKFGFNGLQIANNCLAGGKHKGKTYTNVQFAYGWASHNGWRKNLDVVNNEAHKKINELWNPYTIIGYARALLTAIRERKDILYSCSNKVKLTLELVNKFNDIKTIVFAQSANFADKIGLNINEKNPNTAVVYHSRLASIMMPSEKTGKLIKYGKTRLRNRALDRIKRGLSRILVTVSSLDRGLDIEDIRLGITASGTQNPIQYKQRSGRVKRKETLFSEDTIVLIINIFVKNTRDEVWLSKRQSKSNHMIHTVDNIDNITYKPKSNFNMLND